MDSESGASRAVAFAAAGLMFHQGLSLEASLSKIRSAHPLVASSFHFFTQLKELETSSSDLMERRESRGKEDGTIAPELTDGVEGGEDRVLFTVRCRKCRRELCTSEDCVDHEKPEEDKAFQRRSKYGMHANAQCNSLFLEQQEWFGDTSEPEGKILCPHCGARVGTWKWHGTQCSCSAWVAPAFQIHKGKVDIGKR
jgi:dual specificity phosphatase 12